MARPDFSEIKTFEEFSKYYWYREELIKICRTLGLKSDGGKIELNKAIESYFKASRHPELVSGSATNKIQKKIPKRVRDDQDFCADPATERFPNKLKTAAKLWKIVRESTREKVYKHELLELIS